VGQRDVPSPAAQEAMNKRGKKWFFRFFKSFYSIEKERLKMSLMNADNRHRVIYVGTVGQTIFPPLTRSFRMELNSKLNLIV
jgi:hypothetical protein